MGFKPSTLPAMVKNNRAASRMGFSGAQQGTVGIKGRWNRGSAEQMASQGYSEVSNVPCKERPCPGRHKAGE